MRYDEYLKYDEIIVLKYKLVPEIKCIRRKMTVKPTCKATYDYM